MKVSVYEWGTNKFFEYRSIKVLRDISEINEDKRGWMLTHTNGEKDYLLKSQYKVVTNN